MSKIVLDGAIDLHCHFGPETVIGVPHSVDAFEAARDAAALGFSAIVLKSHDFPSNSVAYAVAQTVDGVKVHGSICCDFCVGGLNPAAVETALRDGAAIVWLPTISSQQDVVNGVAALLGIPGPGIELLDGDGRLVPEVEEILSLVAQYDAIAATGHTSAAEHFALARNFGHRGRLVVTHAMNAGAGPQLTVQDCIELAELGAYIELAAATCMAGHGPSVGDVVKAIEAIGSARIVLSTDYGWNSELPRPAAGLHEYVDALWEYGAPETQLRQMTCDNPARLLRMSA
jgi:hypothetical protein